MDRFLKFQDHTHSSGKMVVTSNTEMFYFSNNVRLGVRECWL